MTQTRVLELLANGIVVEIDGNRIADIEVPSGYVPYSFMPRIDTHLVLSGDRLVNGMIVLLADTIHRENPERISPEYPDRARGFRPTDYDRLRVQETARWAVVTNVSTENRIVSFTAIYADGTMFPRQYNQSIAWAVLKHFSFNTEDQADGTCTYCGEVHDDTAQTVADDPADQSFFDFLDSTANLIGTLLYPDLDNQADRVDAVKASLSNFSDIFTKEFGDIFDSSEENANDRPKKPGESDDEYADRLRDEDEVNGEYSASEAARVKQRAKDDEDLALLREKLTGVPRSQR